MVFVAGRQNRWYTVQRTFAVDRVAVLAAPLASDALLFVSRDFGAELPPFCVAMVVIVAWRLQRRNAVHGASTIDTISTPLAEIAATTLLLEVVLL